MLFIQTLFEILYYRLHLTKDGRHYFIIDGGPRYLPKGTVNFTYTVDCWHCDRNATVGLQEDAPAGFRWMELAANYICDDCYQVVYRF